MNITIIKKPVITEKSLQDAQMGVYTFETDKNARKQQIKKAIEEMFSVHVTMMTTVVTKGKPHRSGKKRMISVRPDKKKARVRLKQGEKIDLFEVGENKK